MGLATSYITKLGRIPFIGILFFIALFFWINGDSFFPNWSSTYGAVILYYIGMLVIFYIFSTTQTERRIDTPLQIASYQFLFGFIISFVVITILSYIGIITPATIIPALIVPTIIMQFCIVAPAEELMFRGVIQSYTGIWVQAVIFSLWHSWAYGIVWYNFGLAAGITSLIFAFIFGLILGYLSRLPSFELPGVIAIHAVYNCILLGALAI